MFYEIEKKILNYFQTEFWIGQAFQDYFIGYLGRKVWKTSRKIENKTMKMRIANEFDNTFHNGFTNCIMQSS